MAVDFFLTSEGRVPRGLGQDTDTLDKYGHTTPSSLTCVLRATLKT